MRRLGRRMRRERKGTEEEGGRLGRDEIGREE